MMNIKSAYFYAALAACLGTGYGGAVIMTNGDIDHVKSIQCEDYSGKPKQETSMRPLQRGQGF